MPGADQQVLNTTESGSYFVQVTDAAGCSANSDTVLVFSTEVPPLSIGNAALMLWPVPVEDRLNIQGLSASDGLLYYEVLDASGRAAFGGKLNGALPTIDVNGLASGPYMLRLTGTGGRRNLRFIKH